ncbi:protein NUCLEAR FUSION DEFECTIVE 2 isoform X2 [Alnus glutinosa]|uniref:protein NUCLEAR FUSION DEFECTIVE 2 isoform X2 n=1 Tax=Alnus glutinosa TaxID=3517 RepID=UPI002D775D49|nr:protein NUCLEAR FUSION DEFECTIVE 2 isoform X2 [Alnus glutinosa]
MFGFPEQNTEVVKTDKNGASEKRKGKMNSRRFGFTVLAILFFTIVPNVQSNAANEVPERSFKPSSPFSTALETLQKQIGYTFQSIGLLRRAMTHASFSEENNRALSILGANVIETSVSLRLLGMDIDISAKDLNRHIAEISTMESSCLADGIRLGLQKVVRVSPKTDSSAPAVVCGAFRAIFGAIAIDAGKSDDAGKVFWGVHGGDVVGTLAL